jgi:hypothetical protein
MTRDICTRSHVILAPPSPKPSKLVVVKLLLLERRKIVVLRPKQTSAIEQYHQ